MVINRRDINRGLIGPVPVLLVNLASLDHLELMGRRALWLVLVEQYFNYYYLLLF